MVLLISLYGFLFSFVFFAVVHTGFAFLDGQRPCHDDKDCLPTSYSCKGNLCVCDRPSCEGPRQLGERCVQNTDCYSPDLICHGIGEIRTCRCRNMHTWEIKYNRCLKDEPYSYDPIQNFIIPAIIVMSVGAMVYLGIKLFCNCGKVWRRQRSQLSRELEGMSSTPHQQTWVASYRVFSPLNNQNQPQLHSAPCMGLFVPNISSSPPPYEEALKHKVILSSYSGCQLPEYSYEPPPPLEEPPNLTNQHQQHRSRTMANSERDHARPLRYYPGEGNPQIPPVWNTVRMTELEEVHHQDRDHPRIQNISAHRGSRNARISRSSRHYSPDQPRRTSVEGTT